MAKAEHLAILLENGVEAWNRWREKKGEHRPDLSRADLSVRELGGINFQGADLNGADLGLAKLCSADLSGATLVKADLAAATLSESDLRGAILLRSDLRATVLRGAKLRGANLRGANLIGTDLEGADLGTATMQSTSIGDVDLSVVDGLKEVHHHGPSTIGTDTLLRTAQGIASFPSRQGEIEAFFRGAGVQENLVEFFQAQIGQPFFQSCFISYGSADEGFANRFKGDLRDNGVRCWFFSEDAKWGGTLWGEIGKGIQDYDRLLVICSEASLKSGPVNREIERALQKEDREGKPVLFPVTLDRYLFDEWEHERKPDVLAKVVGDFTDWKDPDSYKKALKKLLRDLERGWDKDPGQGSPLEK